MTPLNSEHVGGNNIKSKDVTFVLKILAKEKNDKEIMIKDISKVFRCKIIKYYLLQGIMQKKTRHRDKNVTTTSP